MLKSLGKWGGRINVVLVFGNHGIGLRRCSHESCFLSLCSSLKEWRTLRIRPFKTVEKYVIGCDFNSFASCIMLIEN